jgi:hypothetical protein
MLLLGRWEWIIKGNLAQLLQFQRGEHKQRGTNCVLQVRTDGSTDSSTDSSTDGSTDGSTHGSTMRSTSMHTECEFEHHQLGASIISSGSSWSGILR